MSRSSYCRAGWGSLDVVGGVGRGDSPCTCWLAQGVGGSHLSHSWWWAGSCVLEEAAASGWCSVLRLSQRSFISAIILSLGFPQPPNPFPTNLPSLCKSPLPPSKCDLPHFPTQWNSPAGPHCLREKAQFFMVLCWHTKCFLERVLPTHPLWLCLPPLTWLLHCMVCCPTPRVFLGPEIPAWNLCSNLPGTVSESWISPQAMYNSSSPIPPPLQPHSLKIYLLFRMAHTPPPPGSLAWLQARLKASLLFSQHPLYTLCYLHLLLLPELGSTPSLASSYLTYLSSV